MLNLPTLPPRIIPSLLLDEGCFVKTKKFKSPIYIGDPVNTINLFNKFEVDEIVLLDISCHRKKTKPDFELIQQLAEECWVPLSYGGGIRTVEDAKKILNSGVEKVIFQNLLFTDLNEVIKCVEQFGSSSIVGCLDVKKNIFGKYELWTAGNRQRLPLSLEEAVMILKNIKLGEIIVNDISREGTYRGYDSTLIEFICKRVNCPVVALGGASCLEDFKAVIHAGANAASAGSFFVFQNRNSSSVLINYPNRNEIASLFYA